MRTRSKLSICSLLLTCAMFSACSHTEASSASMPGVDPTQAKRVLVVMNVADPDSVKIATYYCKARGIPIENKVVINVASKDEIDDNGYKLDIETPIHLNILKNKNPIDYIVLTKGVPIRLNYVHGYSVDAKLAVMDKDMTPIVIDGNKITRGMLRDAANPYYGMNEPFSHKKFGLFLVTRLDGYTTEDCLKLVDNSMAAKPNKGPFLFDPDFYKHNQSATFGATDDTLALAKDVMTQKGFNVVFSDPRSFVSLPEPLAGYCSWGSNDVKWKPEEYQKLRFLPGAICETFVSTGGRTFTPTTGGQSLIADLIKHGVTGVKGYVSEPFTFALCHPEILFDRYTSGYNLADSFYMASPVIAWKDLVIGDPLCSPYPKKK